MKQFFIFACSTLLLVGCGVKNNVNDTIADSINDTNGQVPEMGHCMGKHDVVFRKDIITFFGKSLIMDDSTHIMKQINDIANFDDRLSVDGRVLTVCNVRFGINILHKRSVVLISSTQVDDPKVRSVVKYVNSIYGTAREEEPYHYWWYVEKDSNDIVYMRTTIRLRRVRSEEGGTTMLFCNQCR